MGKTVIILWALLFTSACQGQDKRGEQQAMRHVGGPCEGCEAVYEFGDRALSPVDTLPGFHQGQGEPLIITGTIFRPDGRTPAQGVILYIYHTNAEGIYPTRGDETGWAKRHGYLRGWIRTGADGRYTFYTIRPGTYPSRSEPAHIHATVKEPGKNAYYLDDFLFEGDPLLRHEARLTRENRGGSGIVALVREGDRWLAERDIVLGRNIPDYD